MVLFSKFFWCYIQPIFPIGDVVNDFSGVQISVNPLVFTICTEVCFNNLICDITEHTSLAEINSERRGKLKKRSTQRVFLSAERAQRPREKKNLQISQKSTVVRREFAGVRRGFAGGFAVVRRSPFSGLANSEWRTANHGEWRIKKAKPPSLVFRYFRSFRFSVLSVPRKVPKDRKKQVLSVPFQPFWSFWSPFCPFGPFGTINTLVFL